MTPTLADLRSRLPALMLRDERRLSRQLDGLSGRRTQRERGGRRPAQQPGGHQNGGQHAGATPAGATGPGATGPGATGTAAPRVAAPRPAAGLADSEQLSQLAAEVAAAEGRIAARQAAVPVITYPAELPVSQRKDELAAAIRDHQVVIIAGETGSGKTTQIPKICLELGRGIRGQIGHTQPRRIAARTVADRIAAELKTDLGSVVGYKVRFADTASDSTLVKVMTDGILLTEMQRDRMLLRYDTLIIDEAHERSLNIDFILGYLKQLLPRRPDLKVIITSATIDPERFSRHFAPSGSEGAPILEVSGRTYPVDVRYRPLAEPGAGEDAEPRDQVQGILDAVAELRSEGPGDVLVFLSGEREIRDTADALAGQADLEVVPLYARLSAAEQYRVFQPHSGRRVVLATNVAETSLTVPGITYVIDPGTARISRYSQRTKVQRLPIEAISRASAHQRTGRCGRTSDGICIRLYSEEDFDSRPEFTDPEILRTNLASVILRMAALDLGVIADFPFVDPPDSRNVADGLRLLEELRAVSPGGRDGTATRLTDTGRKLAELPVDPRLGRMILEAGRNGCLREVLIITAALAIVDPRERPADARDAADAMHRRFAEPGSDFLAFLTLWEYLREQQRQLSSSAFRRLCRREYLHFLRVREWQDVYVQLQQAARDIGLVAGRDRGRPAASTRPRSDRLAELEESSAPRGVSDAGTAPAGVSDVGPASAGASAAATAPLAPARAGAGAQRRKRGAATPNASGSGASTSGPSTSGSRAAGAGASGRRAAAAAPESRYDAGLADRVHQSLLAGLLSHIGMQDSDRRPDGQRSGDRSAAAGQRRRGPAEFLGARGARFAIFPDSPQARKPPQWVMAAELVETSRLWARTVARIEPEWAESLAGDLVRRTYSEPRWDARRGAVMATEKVTLYGLPIVAARSVNYGNIDPAAAREEFIQHALVEGDWETHHRFFARNQQAREQAGELENKARRRGLVADERVVFDFYDQRVPTTVTSARHFDSWWKKARATDPDLLNLTAEDLAGPAADEVSPADYPERLASFRLSYEFSPGEPHDGVTADIPLADLFAAGDSDLGWQVPGLRRELVTELIRGLPKDLRRHFIPAPDTAAAVLAGLGEPGGDLLDALSRELARLTGVRVPRSAWNVAGLPEYLKMRYRVFDGSRVLASGRDLEELRDRLRPELTAALTEAAAGITRTGLTTWDIGTLPEVFTNGQVRGYPALADAGTTVDVRVFDTEEEAARAMKAGTARLLLLAVPSGVRSIASRLPMNLKMAMSRHPYPSAAAMLDDCAFAAALRVVEDAGGPARDQAGFGRLVEAARDRLAPDTSRVLEAVSQILAEAQEVEMRLTQANPVPALAPAFSDMRRQFAALVYPGFIARTGRRLPDVIRYLRAIVRRMDKVADQARDAERMAVVHRVEAAYLEALAEQPGCDLEPVRWMIEELRVNLFAQVLGTPYPVSEKRIMTALAQAGERLRGE